MVFHEPDDFLQPVFLFITDNGIHIAGFHKERENQVVELIGIHLLHVLEIDPVQFIDIEDSIIRGDALHGELFDKLFFREDFLLALRSPAEERQIVHDRFRQVAHIPVFGDRGRAMTLAHLLVIFAEDQGNMTKLRRFIAKRFIDGELARGVREMFFRADDVGDFHERVIDDNSEVVDRNAVGFHDDEITDTGCLEFNMSANHVIKSEDAVFSDFETDDRFSSFGFVLGFFFFGEVAAVFIIDRSLAGIELRLAAFFQLFCAAVAVVRFAFIEKSLYFLLVEIEAFGLAVRTMRAAYVDAFIPVHAEPFQRIFDILFGFLGGTLQIRIFDADEEGAVSVTSNQPVEERGARTTDMKWACRARGKTNFQFLFHLLKLLLIFYK